MYVLCIDLGLLEASHLHLKWTCDLYVHFLSGYGETFDENVY